LRRSPFLVAYWDGSGLIVENYATGVCVAADAEAVALLGFFDRWRTPGQLEAALPDYDPASIRRALSRLLRHSLLERSDRPPPAGTSSLRRWASWNPQAGWFHFSTRDVRYTRDDVAFARALARRARRDPLPKFGKRYPQAPVVPLPAPARAGEFPAVLLSRRTWRRFGRRALSQAELGTLLGLTFGVQGWLRAPGLGRLPLKTSPSGGALHPIEAYVVALRVAGVPRGLYHYDARRHRLERLPGRADARKAAAYLAGDRWAGRAGAILLLTAVFARPQWKYPSARTYRVLLAEAGHLAQTFCLTATWLGLAPFSTMALADSRIERDLGIDGVSEAVLYAVGAGARPPRLANPHLAR
jgi:SagB-type dehydrogenase family enzyme